MSPDAERRFEPGRLTRYIREIFERAGLTAEEAGVMAQAIVTADLRGMSSHGCVRVPIYVEKIRAGGFRSGRKGKVVMDGPAVMLLDGEDGLGQVLAMRAMDEAIAKAKVSGIGACGVRNSNHLGEGALYALRAIESRVIGIVATNSAPIMPAWGGRTMITGPIPITVGVPAGDRPPFLLDAALAMSSRGKVLYAAARGQAVPAGVGVDRDGAPTEDPQAILGGGWLLPIGGYKGWGMALALEILSGVLTGGAVGAEIRDLFDPDRAAPQRLGHFMIAIDIARFMPFAAFAARMDGLIAEIKASELAPGFTEILIPGEPEFRKAATNGRDGIPLGAALMAQLDIVARELGVTATPG